MSRLKRSFSVFIIAALTGCSQAPSDGLGFVARQDTGFATQASHFDVVQLTEQTAQLDTMMRDIVRRSMGKGVAIGAAVGCGLVVLSAANGQNCVAGAVAGGLVGGIAGHSAGKRNVENRIKLLSANDLTKSIRKTNNQLEDIRIDLPRNLAAQDIALAELARKRDAGEVTQAVYATEIEKARSQRRSLVEALTLTEAQAKAATANLQTATAQGQSGLDWQMSATKQLARDVASTRSQITLF